MQKQSDIHLVSYDTSTAQQDKTLAASLQLALERSDEFQACQIQQQARIETLLRMLASLEEAHDHYRVLYEHSPIGYITLDRAFTIVALNLTAATMCGGSKDDFLGRSLTRSLTFWDNTRFRSEMRKRTRNPHPLQLDLGLQRSDGSILQVQCESVRGLLREEEVVRLALVDITERKRAETEIWQLAFHDPLTSLPNRRLLHDRVQSLLTHTAQSLQYSAVVYIDMDNFKSLNDRLGHAAGDLLLIQVAQRLTECIPSMHTVARLGGDEFVVVFHKLGKGATDARIKLKKHGEKLLECLSTRYSLGDYSHQTSGSIGITMFQDATASVETLLQQADLALYAAKAAGPGKLRFFDPGMQPQGQNRAEFSTPN